MSTSQTGDVIGRIFEVFREKGNGAYFGEPVTQTEHALQAAWQAEQAGAPPSQIAAALLHDVGHLLHDFGENVADAGHDAAHEDLGARWLADHFSAQVTEPARLHVAAKRYLCATDPAYLGNLSPASIQSLALQGGPMTQEEVSTFKQNPHWRDALQLRHWDDQAKIAGLTVPRLEHYGCLLESALKIAHEQLRSGNWHTKRK